MFKSTSMIMTFLFFVTLSLKDSAVRFRTLMKGKIWKITTKRSKGLRRERFRSLEMAQIATAVIRGLRVPTRSYCNPHLVIVNQSLAHASTEQWEWTGDEILSHWCADLIPLTLNHQPIIIKNAPHWTIVKLLRYHSSVESLYHDYHILDPFQKTH